MTLASPTARTALGPPSVFVLAWPVALLLLEATVLTPFVEFRVGGMAYLADPQFLTAGIVALAAFFLIVLVSEEPPAESALDPAVAGEVLVEPQVASGGSHIFRPLTRLRWGQVGVHLVLLAAFVWLTLALDTKSKIGAVAWPYSIGWITLAGCVALSILAAFVPLASVWAIVSRFTWQGAIAAAIGTGQLLLTPFVRSYWPEVDDPLLSGMNALLAIFPGNPLIGLSSNRWPIIGTSHMSLLVTPPCSELDSLLVFALLAGTLWAAMGSRLSAWKFLLLISAGMAGIYALLSLRLYFMILLGLWANDPYVAVDFAHSRISTLALLVYTMLVLGLGSKFCRPTVRTLPVPVEPELEE